MPEMALPEYVHHDEYVLVDSAGERRVFVCDVAELTEKFVELRALSKVEFMRRLPEALHFATYVSWLKQDVGAMSDLGVVHELIHLLVMPDEPVIEYDRIRRDFADRLAPPYRIPGAREGGGSDA